MMEQRIAELEANNKKLREALQYARGELLSLSESFDWLGTGSDSKHAAKQQSDYEKEVIGKIDTALKD
jgi:hypothetical protein